MSTPYTGASQDVLPLEQADSLEPANPLGATLNATAEDVPISSAIKVYATTLGLNDVDSLVDLESATFPPHQRCSREKFIYRIGACGELCHGLFTSAVSSTPAHEVSTASTANAPDTTDSSRKGVLLAHIIGTKTVNKTILDDDMALGGHNEAGRTIAIHSLAVLPGYQKRGYGSLLLKDFCQRMAVAENADYIALLTYDYLVSYYEKFGFVNIGKSTAKFGIDGDFQWNDMLLDLRPLRDHMNDLEYEDEYTYEELEVSSGEPSPMMS